MLNAFYCGCGCGCDCTVGAGDPGVPRLRRQGGCVERGLHILRDAGGHLPVQGHERGGPAEQHQDQGAGRAARRRSLEGVGRDTREGNFNPLSSPSHHHHPPSPSPSHHITSHRYSSLLHLIVPLHRSLAHSFSIDTARAVARRLRSCWRGIPTGARRWTSCWRSRCT